jgi:catechol 2,3-dioxygenase-like lactoylglutathione lyase family enzyme
MSATSRHPLGKLGTVTVYVNDQDAAKAFYTEQLGLELRSDMPMDETSRWLTVAIPGGETEIVLYRDTGRAGQGPGLVFNTTEIQRAYEELSGRGVSFTETPTQQAWGGIQAQFQDQDGNGYVLVQLPSGFPGQ